VLDLSHEIKRRMNDPQFPVSSAYVIVPADEPLKDPVEFDYKTAIDAAQYNRFELAQQLVRIDQARIAEQVAYNNRLPRLDFIGSFGIRGLGQTIGEAADRSLDFNTPSWAFGVEFEYPIGNRVARSILARARLQRQQAIEQFRNLTAQVSLDVRIAMNDIQSSWDQAIARTQSRLASRRQLDLIQRQQDLGEAITPSFVQIKLQAQEELANAAREEAAAVAGYNIAIQRLERAKGTLLKYNNVKIAEDPSQAYLRRTWASYETDPARGAR
jgi:outer membrane protein TolC